MTAAQFRRLALALSGVEEGSHMGHPDFRAGGKIFATLGSPDKAWGMIKLTPEQQHEFMMSAPDVFKAAAGAWGKRGSTLVHLAPLKPTVAKQALSAAYTVVSKQAVKPKH